MNHLREFDVVRITSVASASYWEGMGNETAQIGDIGTIVGVLGQDRFVVESVLDDGQSAWLCDFGTGELELVERPVDST